MIYRFSSLLQCAHVFVDQKNTYDQGQGIHAIRTVTHNSARVIQSVYHVSNCTQSKCLRQVWFRYVGNGEFVYIHVHIFVRRACP